MTPPVVTSSTISDILAIVVSNKKKVWCIKRIALTIRRSVTTGTPDVDLQIKISAYGSAAGTMAAEDLDGRSDPERINLANKFSQFMEFIGNLQAEGDNIDDLTATIDNPVSGGGPYLYRLSAWVGNNEKYAWVFNDTLYPYPPPPGPPTGCLYVHTSEKNREGR